MALKIWCYTTNYLRHQCSFPRVVLADPRTASPTTRTWIPNWLMCVVAVIQPAPHPIGSLSIVRSRLHIDLLYVEHVTTSCNIRRIQHYELVACIFFRRDCVADICAARFLLSDTMQTTIWWARLNHHTKRTLARCHWTLSKRKSCRGVGIRTIHGLGILLWFIIWGWERRWALISLQEFSQLCHTAPAPWPLTPLESSLVWSSHSDCQNLASQTKKRSYTA